MSTWLNVHDNDLEVISTNFRLVGMISGNLTGHEFFQMRTSCIKGLERNNFYFRPGTHPFWPAGSGPLVWAIFVAWTYRCSVSCSCALTFRFNLTYCNQNCLFPFIEFRFEVYRYRLMNHKLTVSHSLSGNEFSIAIFKILSKQESICARLSLTDSFNFVLQISINYFPNII